MRYQCKTQTGKVLFEIVAESLYPALQAAEIQLYKMFGDYCEVQYESKYADYDIIRDMTVVFNDGTMIILIVVKKEE